MEPEVFVLCDAATEGFGKLNLLGAFDTIYATALPAVHPQCAIVARIRFDPSEGEEHSIQITLRDKTGKAIIPPLQSKIKLNFEIPDYPARLNMIISLNSLTFETYGTNLANLEIDGKLIAQIPFLISKPRSTNGSSGKKG
jgi:hypothetical protein